MKLLPSYINGRERELYKETEDGQEVFYYEDKNIIIRNFLPEDATAWCVCMHPEFIRTPISRRREILKDIRERINRDLDPEPTCEGVLVFTYMVARKNGKMAGTICVKEYPGTDNEDQRTVVVLYLKDKKENMELKTLEAFKRLQEEYCWYDRIFISNESGSEEVPLDEKIEKLRK